MSRLLIILGSPLWIVLLIAAAAVALSLAASLWVIVLCLWVLFLALLLSSPISVIAGIVSVSLCEYPPLTLVTALGFAMLFSGLAIFSYSGCLYATKGSFKLTRKTFWLLKNQFERR